MDARKGRQRRRRRASSSDVDDSVGRVAVAIVVFDLEN